MKNQETLAGNRGLEMVRTPTKFPSFMSFDIQLFLAYWDRFYQDVYNITINMAMVLLPSVENTLGAGVLMIPGITIEQDLAQIKERTAGKRLHRYTVRDMDDFIVQKAEPARPKGSYAAWCFPAVEATDQAPHLAEKSYLDNRAAKEPVMLFREYTRFFLWHFWATGQPLDRDSMTLSGSLDMDGRVLRGRWRDGKFSISGIYQQHTSDNFCARQVLSPLA